MTLIKKLPVGARRALPANLQALTLILYPAVSSRNCIPLSFIDVVQMVGFFTSAEVAERISEAV